MNLQLELTNRCNLKCVECPNRLMKRKRHFMSEEIFDKVLYEYITELKYGKDGMLPTVILHKDGEPFLHPQLSDFMAKISKVKPDCKIDIYTNGLLLTPEFFDFVATLPNLVRLLVTFHFFNYDGSRNDYNKVNHVLVEGLMKQYINLEVVIATHSTKYTTQEMVDNWEEFWTLGVKNKSFRRLTGIHKNAHINPWGGLITEGDLVHFESCPYGDFGHWFIGVTGNVIPCCIDLEEEVVFGNVMEEDKLTIGKRVQAFYEEIYDGKINRDLCHRCLNR